MGSDPDRSRNRPARWLRQRRDHRAVRPLWNFLQPVIAARRTVTVMRAETSDRFERRLMEIRDALRVLDGYRLEPPAAVTHAGGDAAREAAILVISLQLWYDRNPRSAPTHGGASAHLDDLDWLRDLAAEVAFLPPEMGQPRQ